MAREQASTENSVLERALNQMREMQQKTKQPTGYDRLCHGKTREEHMCDDHNDHDEHEDDTPIPDFCRICDQPTDRTDRLCDLHHNAALDLSDNLRRLRP